MSVKCIFARTTGLVTDHWWRDDERGVRSDSPRKCIVLTDVVATKCARRYQASRYLAEGEISSSNGSLVIRCDSIVVYAIYNPIYASPIGLNLTIPSSHNFAPAPLPPSSIATWSLAASSRGAAQVFRSAVAWRPRSCRRVHRPAPPPRALTKADRSRLRHPSDGRHLRERSRIARLRD